MTENNLDIFKEKETIESVISEVHKKIVGQKKLVRDLLVCLLA
jgi:hypothetical protein